MPKNKTRKNIFKSMNINRAQAQALADGFVDAALADEDFKDELQPRETLTELFLLVGEFIESAQQNLIDSHSIGKGLLSQSLKANEPTESGKTIFQDVVMNFYGRFVNSGVKGTKSGTSKLGYSFKNPFPNRKMALALAKGISHAQRTTRTVRQYKPVSAHEVKQRSISDIDKAYGAARNIKMFGIAATGFIDKAAVTTANKVQDRLGAAFKIDIINSI